jgi:geranylgeranyl reductase family protein
MVRSGRTQCDVIVVGSGPAGISTAMHLTKLDPALRGRVIVLEKVSHPRKKVCGGGLSQYAMHLLRRLDIAMEMPLVKVTRARIVFDSNAYSETVMMQPVELRTVMREDFDEMLVRSARSLGVEVIENEPAISFDFGDDAVVVHTRKRDLATEVLVGADGATSTVRRALNKKSEARTPRTVCAAVRFMEKHHRSVNLEHGNLEAVMDFSCTSRNGIRGYAWSFPVITRGQAWLNTGIGGFNISQKKDKSLKQVLEEYLASQGLSMDASRLEGHPIHWFHPSSMLSAHRVLLVGDAAGIDPLWGEGISFSLGYGEIAASAIARAFQSEDFSFSSYKAHLLDHELGKALMDRLQLADRLYRYPISNNVGESFMSALSLRQPRGAALENKGYLC